MRDWSTNSSGIILSYVSRLHNPEYRYVRLGSPKQNSLLEKLVADVTDRDPEPRPATSTFKTRM